MVCVTCATRKFPQSHAMKKSPQNGWKDILVRHARIRQYRYFPISRHRSGEEDMSVPFVESVRRRYFPTPGHRTGMGKYQHESVVSDSTDTSSYQDIGPAMRKYLHRSLKALRRRYFPTPGHLEITPDLTLTIETVDRA